VLVVGRNGSGKTNLLESLHVGTQGFSPRTRVDGQLVRFGTEEARVAVAGRRAEVPVEVELRLARSGKRATLNGARLRAAEQLRTELATLVFTPDRLALVKGGPAARRAYFDRTLGRISPSRAALPAEYGAAVGQRNAALRRIAGDKVAARIRRESDPLVARIVAGWPRRFDPRRALALGFRGETSFDDIIRVHIDDELSGKIVN